MSKPIRHRCSSCGCVGPCECPTGSPWTAGRGANVKLSATVSGVTLAGSMPWAKLYYQTFVTNPDRFLQARTWYYFTSTHPATLDCSTRAGAYTAQGDAFASSGGFFGAHDGGVRRAATGQPIVTSSIATTAAKCAPPPTFSFSRYHRDGAIPLLLPTYGTATLNATSTDSSVTITRTATTGGGYLYTAIGTTVVAGRSDYTPYSGHPEYPGTTYSDYWYSYKWFEGTLEIAPEQMAGFPCSQAVWTIPNQMVPGRDIYPGSSCGTDPYYHNWRVGSGGQIDLFLIDA